MRRSTRLGLAIVVALLVLFGVYTGFWFYAASHVEDGLGQGVAALHAQQVAASWHSIRVGGFPFAFDVELREARLSDHAGIPGVEIRAPRLRGTARPWNPRIWRVAAPDGLSATTTAPGKPAVTLKAQTATGSVAIGAEGGARVWVGLAAFTADGGAHLAARDVDAWFSLPSHPPRTHTEPAFGVALAAREVTLPMMPAAFSKPLDELALGATVRGAIPAAPAREAATAWRDSGGTLELDHFTLHWGALAITGSGTVALDAQLQPIAAFSGEVEGYPELIGALVAAGHIPAGEARLARLGLALLSHTGADGRPQIKTSFRIQNGEMYLGPAKLGPAPHIAWP